MDGFVTWAMRTFYCETTRHPLTSKHSAVCAFERKLKYFGIITYITNGNKDLITDDDV